MVASAASGNRLARGTNPRMPSNPPRRAAGISALAFRLRRTRDRCSRIGGLRARLIRFRSIGRVQIGIGLTLAGAVSISAAALSVVISAASARQFSGCRSGRQLRCHPWPIHWVEHDLGRDSNRFTRLWQA